MNNADTRKAEGGFLAMSITVALIVGIVLGVLTGRYGLWIAISVAVGVGVGQAIIQQRRTTGRGDDDPTPS